MDVNKLVDLLDEQTCMGYTLGDGLSTYNVINITNINQTDDEIQINGNPESIIIPIEGIHTIEYSKEDGTIFIDHDKGCLFMSTIRAA